MNGELYPGEFEAMERQGRLDAVMPEQKMMTREEAIEVLTNHTQYKCNGDDLIALDIAIEALEQEPCENAVSKQAVLDLAVKIELPDSQTFFCISPEDVGALPPVNPQPCEDAISRKLVLDIINFEDKWLLDAKGHNANTGIAFGGMRSKVSALSSVTPKQRTGWIPFTYRPATDEEKKDFAKRTGYDEEDIDAILNCQLPEDGETVLITDRLGNVEVDTFINDCDGCYFECNCDMEDVRAWMPLPEPYKAESEEQS